MRSHSSHCFPFSSGEGSGMGWVKLPCLGFLTILGLVGFSWSEELEDDEFFFWMCGNGEGEDEK